MRWRREGEEDIFQGGRQGVEAGDAQTLRRGTLDDLLRQGAGLGGKHPEAVSQWGHRQRTAWQHALGRHPGAREPDLHRLAGFDALAQRRGCVDCRQPAAIDDGDPVAELIGLLHVVGGEEDRHPRSRFRRAITPRISRVLATSRPEVGSSRNRMSGSLTNAMHNISRWRRPLESCRPFCRARSASLERFQQLGGTRRADGLRDAMQLGHQHDVLPDREVGVGVGLFRHHAHVATGGRGMPGHVVSRHPGLPPCREEEAGEKTGGRCLAGPVGSEEAEHFAVLDREAQGVDGEPLTEPAGQARGRERSILGTIVCQLRLDPRAARPHRAMARDS